jgi:hypothetical protein
MEDFKKLEKENEKLKIEIYRVKHQFNEVVDLIQEFDLNIIKKLIKLNKIPLYINDKDE